MLLNEIISKEQFEKGSKYRKEVNKSYSGKEHLKSLPAIRDIMKKLSPDGRFHRTLVFDYDTLKSQYDDKDNTGISVVMDFLRKLGYQITSDSYSLNIASKDDKQYTFKEIFNNLEGQLKTYQKNIVDPLDKHQKGERVLDEKVVNSLKKRLSIVDEYQRNVRQYVRKEKTDSGLKIVISILPRVIASQSTEVAWRSCQNLNDGIYRKNVGSGISAGVLIAFLIKKDDLEMDNPLGRVLIKPMVNKNKTFWYVDKAYGVEKSFRETLIELFDSFNVKLKYGNYELKKDIYNDGVNNIKFDENYVNRKLISKLFDHVLQGDIDGVKLLLKDPRVDPSADDNQAIKLASENGHTEIVKLLLEDPRVDPSARDNYVIRWASANGHTEIVKLLLKDPRVDPSADDNHAIRWASHNGHVDIVELLLKDRRVDPSAHNNKAIRWASENGRAEVVKLLLKDPRVDPSNDNNYVIRRASENGRVEVVELLLKDSRVDPSDSNNQAIRFASENGHAKVVKLLLNDKRVDPSVNNNYAIKLASENGHAKVVKLLLNDKRVDPSDNNNNNYAIAWASENGHVDVVELLLKDGRVDPSNDNNHVIRRASENGHAKVVELLLNDKRVNPSAYDNQAIRFASENGHVEVVKLLLKDRRVDPSDNNNYAIIWAVQNGHIKVVKLLLKDKRVKDTLGKKTKTQIRELLNNAP